MAAVNKNLDPAEYRPVVGWMLDALPHGHTPDIYKFMEVSMKRGDNIKAHKHAHHAVLYYPDESDCIIITPQPGTMIYMPPGTLHEVPVVKKARRSIALLVSP